MRGAWACVVGGGGAENKGCALMVSLRSDVTAAPFGGCVDSAEEGGSKSAPLSPLKRPRRFWKSAPGRSWRMLLSTSRPGSAGESTVDAERPGCGAIVRY